MDPIFNDPIHFSEGINIRNLLTMPTEVKLEFKKKKDVLNDDDIGLDLEDEDSSDDDVLATIEEQVDNLLLASPEYHTFEQLGSKMTDCVCPTGGVKLLIIEEGQGPLISLDAEVTYHYAAYWEGAKLPFDSTLTMNQGKPLRQRVGMGMLPGITFGFLNVRGPTARFFLLLQPNVAYLDCGVPPRIRPSEPVLFVVMLYDVRNLQAAARFNDLPKAVQAKFDVAMNAIKDIREEGKDLFKRQKFKRAIKSYEHAISIIRLTEAENEAEEAEIRNIKVKIFVNLAVCYYKIDKPKHVITMCENIDRYIDINTHCKGLFYYGRAYEMQGKVEDAIKYYKKALKLEPKNKEIGATLSQLDERTKKSVANEKLMWQKVFNKEDVKEKAVYVVDEDFKSSVLEMCNDLSDRNEYAKFDLPVGLTKDEVDCIKSLTSQFKGLVFTFTDRKMLRFLFFAAFLQCTISQQYQQKVAPGVPPQNYQNYQQPPPPPPPQQQPQYQQQQQYQPPPQQQQQQQQYQQMPPPQQQQPPQQQFAQQPPPNYQQQPPQQQQQGHGHNHQDPQLLNPANIAQERDHIQEHMEVPIDTSKMSEQELQFHYFKMHDADNNNKLDGCELIKSLIHWHGQIDKDHAVYPDDQLEEVLALALSHTDLNDDGYVDYTEYRLQDYKAKKARLEKETPGLK
ncbi:unnamed protein product [Arctia plantaginis]|uniref:peptidylprolyl isomerase n=1 Tax=Arctia plantaginis TaxID=874455 RepID=A0A8S1ACD1_ARCPL|nr:unnamed protein product [Arctia plantaginis]